MRKNRINALFSPNYRNRLYHRRHLLLLHFNLDLPLYPFCFEDQIRDAANAWYDSPGVNFLMLVALEEGVDVAAIASASPAIIVPETLDPINLLGVLRRARGSFVIVTNEFGVVQGLVTPLDVLEAIAGEFPDADETPEIITDGDGWLVKGGTDLHALQQALDVEHLADDDDIATVAGLVISANGHIPRVGDVIDVGPLHITIIEANDYRVDLVRIVKEQPAHDEDE